MSAHVMTIHAMSSVHPGTGSADGTIDMPIAREKTTNVPIIPGSTIKGVLRGKADGKATSLFGDASRAGVIHFSDAYVLLMPVRSLAGVYALVTSPYLIRRFCRDVEICGKPRPLSDAEIHNLTIIDSAVAHVTNASQIVLNQTRIVLEDIELRLPKNSTVDVVSKLAVAIKFFVPTAQVMEQLCVVHDDVMSFLLETATEVRGRNRLDDNKVVAPGQLWYEEMLPAESVLSGIVNVVAAQPKHAMVIDQLNTVCNQPVVFGGKATTGHGYCYMRLTQ